MFLAHKMRVGGPSEIWRILPHTMRVHGNVPYRKRKENVRRSPTGIQALEAYKMIFSADWTLALLDDSQSGTGKGSTAFCERYLGQLIVGCCIGIGP